jgi:hypothetical protein
VIRNHITGYNAWPNRSKFVKRFAVPVLYTGQVLVLPVSRRYIVAYYIAKYIVKGIFVWPFVKVFAILADYYTELALVR